MPSSWWGEVLLGFFFGIGFAIGTALIKGLVSLIAGHVSKTP